MLDTYKFPLGGWIILVHEILERYAYYGTRGSMTMYMNQVLNYSETWTMIIYHIFSAFVYFVPIIGAVIADNYWGPFKTVVVIGLVYLIGHIMLPIAAVWSNSILSLIGLFIMGFGAGGIKSSVAAFGGDQINPNNKMMIERYFALFYTAINVGSFVTQFVTPILAKEVACIDDRCYPLAFGVPAAVFLITYVLFVCGKSTYRIVQPSRNVIFRFLGCVRTACVNYWKSESPRSRPSLLDYARDTYPDSFVKDSKMALRILIIFAPLPVFWALFDQQGSSWVLQAKYMDGRVGQRLIKPSQLLSINPLLIILFIPLFDLAIYPTLAKCRLLVTHKSRLVTSYGVTAIAFVITGSLHLLIQRGYTIDYGVNNSRVHVVNYANNCTVRIDDSFATTPYNVSTFSLKPGHHQIRYCGKQQSKLKLELHEMVTVVVNPPNNVSVLRVLNKTDEYGHFRRINISSSGELYLRKLKEKFYLRDQYTKLDVGFYDIFCQNKLCGHVTIVPGMIGSILVQEKKARVLYEFTPKLVHMLWQLPQNIMMSTAEILCSVTALSLAYSEAPSTMKSLMMAAYLLSIFWGNLIVVLITATGGDAYPPSTLCFSYAGLAILAGAVNWYLFILVDSNHTKDTNDQEITEC